MMKRILKIAGIVLVVLVVIGIVAPADEDTEAGGSSNTGSDESSQTEVRETDAPEETEPEPEPADAIEGEIFCERFVEERLKAPTTAEFHDATSTVRGQVVTVSGQVASENSFGGTVDNSYTCKVRDLGDSWRLVSLAGLDR